MTFAQYAAQLGVLLLQWLPICAIMYIAVRKGVEHGIKHGTANTLTALDTAARNAFDKTYERAKISEP